ncbi:hypothetical protein [Streptomyces guryensis]|uniref:Uncharacterized protein n=1 Tax=Streptomyces guryensis TaxID=2886947 RepID=A0A9Q3VNK0_9ACTN|nr:hypothetical protein [Streptomyces guryensis]MCD9874952.1 hypothetical protein [Streptomyces guryensis]
MIEALAPWLRGMQGYYAATSLGSHDARRGGAGVLGRGDPVETAAGAGEREHRPAGEDPGSAVAAPVEVGLREHAAVGDRSQRAGRAGQAAVVDDEPLLVPAPPAAAASTPWRGAVPGTASSCTRCSRTGDPEQGLVVGERPARQWAEAATDRDPNLGGSDPAIRRFRLLDGHGGHVYPEGVPAGTEPLDGTRVLVLHPPNGAFGMGLVRVFEST